MTFSDKMPGRACSLSPGVLLVGLRDFRKTTITSSFGLRLRRVRYSHEDLLTMKTMVLLEEYLDTILIGILMFETDPTSSGVVHWMPSFLLLIWNFPNSHHREKRRWRWWARRRQWRRWASRSNGCDKHGFCMFLRPRFDSF